MNIANKMMNTIAKAGGPCKSVILGPCRKRPAVVARRAVWYALYYWENWSYPQIARDFNRDQSTIWHGVKNTDKYDECLRYINLLGKDYVWKHERKPSIIKTLYRKLHKLVQR